MNSIANRLVRASGVEPVESAAVGGQDIATIRQLVEHSAKVGTLEPEMQQQLSGFIDLGTMPVIALVSTDVIPTQVYPKATAADVRAAGLESGHMRILIAATGGGLPSVVHVRDTLLLPDSRPAVDIARPAFVLDAQTPVYEALVQMRASSVQIAVVMQNDVVSGIITLADILKRVLPTGGGTGGPKVALQSL